MSYYNDDYRGGYGRRSYGRGYGRGSYGRGSYGRGYGGGRRKKRTGCKMGMGKNQRPYISAWNVSRSRGMMTLIASPTDEQGESPSTGAKWEKWVCKIQLKRNFEDKLVTGFYYPTTHTLSIPDLGMIARPKAPNGGYFGSPSRKR